MCSYHVTSCDPMQLGHMSQHVGTRKRTWRRVPKHGAAHRRDTRPVTRLELGRSTATIVVVLALAACSRSSERAAPEGDPVPSTVTDEVVATPARVSAGGLVVLTFPDETFRGVAWELARRDGGETSQGPFLLVAATDAFDCASCPLWYPAGEGGSEDIGISGPGPDLVRIPEVAEACLLYTSPSPRD